MTEIGARDLGDSQRYNMLEVSGTGMCNYVFRDMLSCMNMQL